jgi:hypothetical protein
MNMYTRPFSKILPGRAVVASVSPGLVANIPSGGFAVVERVDSIVTSDPAESFAAGTSEIA